MQEDCSLFFFFVLYGETESTLATSGITVSAPHDR
jgi:hypothetical protein